MRYAILGDIHSNWEALSAVITRAKDLQVNRFISVGDIVGYGPNPEECIDLLAALPCDAVAGNHDQAVAGLTDFSQYSEGARAGILWTQEKIGKTYVDRLKELPLVREMEDFSVVHASLDKPVEWNYILDNKHAMASILLQKQGICFYGHTHLPVIFREDGAVSFLREGPVTLSRNHHYLINAGSVGQPRDGNSSACLLVYDSELYSVQMHRCEYNFVKTQEKILQEGLPSFLALRLSYGR